MQVSKYIPYHWTCSKDTKFMVSRETEKKKIEKYEKKAFYQNCVYMVPLSGDQVQGLGQYTRINTAHFI